MLVNVIGCGGAGNAKSQNKTVDQSLTVSAGPDQSVLAHSLVRLTATVSENNSQTTSYHWKQTSGTQLAINNLDTETLTFVAPDLSVPEIAETLTFEVEVTDANNNSANDSVIIVVLPDEALPDCTLTISPGDLFEDAFAQLSSGQTLCLNDGLYTQAMEIPSNTNVRAVNDGMAELDGMDTLGIEWQGGILTMQGNNSSVRGLRVHNAGIYSDACTINGSNNRMRVMSCSHGGSHKHKIPLKISGTGHLIEDSWFYGEGRYVVQCYTGNNIVIRRNVIRWDSTIAGEPDEPNASMSNYSCSDMIWENNISIDYGVPETYMIHCGDICMSTTESLPNYRVQYLGNIVINHASDTGNNIAFRADQKASSASSNITIKDFYVKNVETGIVFNPIYKNISISNCTTINVNADGWVSNQAISCDDTANIRFKYISGIKTNQPLFPWVNEALIKRDFCASGERQSTWCLTPQSLTEYILN